MRPEYYQNKDGSDVVDECIESMHRCQFTDGDIAGVIAGFYYVSAKKYLKRKGAKGDPQGDAKKASHCKIAYLRLLRKMEAEEVTIEWLRSNEWRGGA